MTTRLFLGTGLKMGTYILLPVSVSAWHVTVSFVLYRTVLYDFLSVHLSYS